MATNISRAGRKKQVLEVLEREGVTVNTYKLAELCGMEYGSHFRNLIYEMHYVDKTINMQSFYKKNGKPVFFWYLPSVEVAEQMGLPL